MTRKYSRVERFVWRDPEFRQLDDLAQHIWLHLLTCPLSIAIPGLIPASLTMIADEMGKTLTKGFAKAFEDLKSLGWVSIDPVARLIYIPGSVSHNMPESDNVIKGWAAHFDEVPNCNLRNKWLENTSRLFEVEPGKDGGRHRAFTQAFGKALESLSKGIPEAFRTPDPDPEQDPDHDPPYSPPRVADDATPTDFDAFWAAYPKKVGKAAARQKWKQTAKTRPPLADVLAAIEAQRRSDQWTRDGGQYVPNPATWLHQGRWADELREAAAPEKDEAPWDRQNRLYREGLKRDIERMRAEAAERGEELEI